MTYLNYYKRKLGTAPSFIKKYLKVKSLQRLKKVSYFCGMDYASKDIYKFREYISRYDHSLTVALLTYKLTKSKKETIAALFHDIATPCFSHVIDYMNHDFSKQETTEEYTERIILEDKELLEILREDKINPSEIINFKNYSIVDNERPRLCADRVDGIILTGISWSENITLEDIDMIIDNLDIYNNEDNLNEIGFINESTANRVIQINSLIDKLTHSKEDNYMMVLLGDITRKCINKKLFTYDDLFYLTEEEIYNIMENSNNQTINKLLTTFKMIKKEEIPDINLSTVKKRLIRPLVKGKRLK